MKLSGLVLDQLDDQICLAARAHMEAARFAYLQGDDSTMMQEAENARAACCEYGDQMGAGVAAMYLGVAWVMHQEQEIAARWFNRARSAFHWYASWSARWQEGLALAALAVLETSLPRRKAKINSAIDLLEATRFYWGLRGEVGRLRRLDRVINMLKQSMLVE